MKIGIRRQFREFKTLTLFCFGIILCKTNNCTHLWSYNLIKINFGTALACGSWINHTAIFSYLYIEGFWPEWYISSMVYSWDIPFWLETLDIIQGGWLEPPPLSPHPSSTWFARYVLFVHLLISYHVVTVTFLCQLVVNKAVITSHCFLCRYAQDYIKKAPNNESSWNYLKG